MDAVVQLPRDINKICRTCMNFTDDSMLSQNYTVYNNQITELGGMLQNITSLQISPEDSLPVTLCSRCVNYLKTAHSFIRKCEVVDQNIRKLVKLSDRYNIEYKGKYIPNANGVLSINTPLNFACQICSKAFISNYELSVHMITHNNGKGLSEIFKNYRSDNEEIKQDVCDREDYMHNQFLIEEYRRKGYQSVNDINNVCLESNLSILTSVKTVSEATEEISNELCKPKIEIKSCDDENIYFKCTLCEKKFPNLSSLSLHFLKHSLALEIPLNNEISQFLFCETCGQILNDDSSLIKHYVEQHTGKPTWECGKCVESFDHETELLKHNGLAHLVETKLETNEILQCILCSANFSSKAEILKHSITHLSKRFSCKKCPLKFCTQFSYFVHLETHSGIKYKCNICGKCLSSRSALRSHTEGVHPIELKHSCVTCGKCFSTSARLKLHLKIHTTDKQYICSYCGYSSHKSGDLKVHTRIHTSERPYKCTFSNCSMTFKTSSHLCEHVRRHLNIRMHKCGICAMTFSTGNVLKNHLLQHTGEKPHLCIVCEKTFRRKYHLHVHMKQHNY